MDHHEAAVADSKDTAEPSWHKGMDRGVREHLVGRYWELVLVDHLLSELRNGHGGLLLITGQPGIGKTRIATELVDRTRTGADRASVVIDASGEVASARLWRRVLDESALVLGGVTGGGQSSVDIATSRSIVSALRERPGASLVVVVDGLQCSDLGELSVVDDLLPDLHDMPLLLVLTATTRRGDALPQPLSRWRDHHNTTHLDLRPLPAETVLDLVEAELPGVSRETIEAIAAASGGNPGIARQLCGWTSHPGEDSYPSVTTWLAAEGSLGAAFNFMTERLARDPDQEVQLLLLAGRCAVKSGAHSLGLRYLERALASAEAMADRELFAGAVAEFLEATAVGAPTARRRPELVVQALRVCPPSAVALQARLEAQRALMTCPGDPAEYRVIAEHAVALARQSGDPEAIGFALAARVANPVPHEVEEYTRIGAEASRLPGTAARGALSASVYSAMVTGRREALDAAMRAVAARPVAPGDRFIRGRAAECSAGRAILDAEEVELVDALRRLTIESPPTASFVVPAAVELWRAHTGRVLLPPAPCPDIPRHIVLLVTALEHLVSVGADDPVERQRLADLVARLPDQIRLPRDFTWSTWQAVTARAGALLGDVDRCSRAVEQLGPFVDQFIVLGVALPVGPVGWFLADPLCLLGRGEEALDANTQAERVSRDLRSLGWVARCLIQRGRLLRRQDPAAAVAALTEARQVADEIGLTPLVEQAGTLLDGIRADIADPAVGSVSHWPNTPEPVAGPDDEPGVADGNAVVRAAGLGQADIDIIRHAAAGNTNAQIARIMHLSVPTIERRLTNVYRRLGVRNRAQAVSLVLQSLNTDD